MKRRTNTKTKRKQHFKRRGGTDNRTIKVPVKYGTTFTYAAATTQNDLRLSFGSGGFDSATRAYDIAQAFVDFRIIKLHATIYPYNDTSTTDNVFALAYLPSTDNTAGPDTFTFSQIQNVSCLALVPAKKTMPTSLNVSSSYLMSVPQKWFACDGAGSSPNDAIQGSLILLPRTTATATIVIELSLIFEFKIPTIDAKSGMFPPVKPKAVEEVLSDTDDFEIVKRYKKKNLPVALLG